MSWSTRKTPLLVRPKTAMLYSVLYCPQRYQTRLLSYWFRPLRSRCLLSLLSNGRWTKRQAAKSEGTITCTAISIPQQNQSQKASAVNSRYTYAPQADAMIIVAPDSQHRNQKIPPTFRPTSLVSGRERNRSSSSPNVVRAKMFIMTADFISTLKVAHVPSNSRLCDAIRQDY